MECCALVGAERRIEVGVFGFVWLGGGGGDWGVVGDGAGKYLDREFWGGVVMVSLWGGLCRGIRGEDLGTLSFTVWGCLLCPEEQRVWMLLLRVRM